MSPYHASTVALVRNLNTGSIGPQFHVVYDNWFETVHAEESEEPPPEWEILVNHSRFCAEFDEDDIDKLHLDDEWLTPSEIIVVREQIHRERERSRQQKQRPKHQQPRQSGEQESSSNRPVSTIRQDTSVKLPPSRGRDHVEPTLRAIRAPSTSRH